MKKIFNLSLITFIIILFTGCGQNVTPPIYKWGNYEKSSYDYGMDKEKKEVLEKHIKELKKIIEESEQENRRVAPGIYAELGQTLYETNKKESAKKYFLLEEKTYPESTVFINRILIKLYGE